MSRQPAAQPGPSRARCALRALSLKDLAIDDIQSWQPRTEAELLRDQLGGIDAWHRAARARRGQADGAEQRLESLGREQQALVRRAAWQLHESVRLLDLTVPARAVLAHPDPAVLGQVARRLADRDVTVLLHLDDGADVVGCCVVEQPDLVLVSDGLSSLPVLEVVQRLRRYAPRTVVGATTSCTDVVALLEAGARAVFSTRVAAAEVADGLVSCLHGIQPA